MSYHGMLFVCRVMFRNYAHVHFFLLSSSHSLSGKRTLTETAFKGIAQSSDVMIYNLIETRKKLIAKVEGYDKQLVVYLPKTLCEKTTTNMAAACRIQLA